MKIINRTVIVSVILLGAFVLVGCAIWRPIGNISVYPAIAPSVGGVDTDGHVGAGLKITAYVTGWVEAPANILIDQSTPELPDSLRQPQWVPSIAYAVRHPKFGVVIIDAGLKSGPCDYGLRPIYWVSCRNTPGSDLVSQLHTAGIRSEDIRYIVPSHFHGDHISGLSGLLDFADAPVLMMEVTLNEIRSPLRFTSGIPSKMLKADMHVVLLDSYLETDVTLGRAFDVFGDGSLKVFPTPGHSHGHLSAIAKTGEQTFLLTFDASHLAANFELNIPSGSIASEAGANDSLTLLNRIADSQENLQIIFGHEPRQWECIVLSVELDDAYSPCSATQH